MVDPNYQKLVHLSTTVKSGWKYARWDLVQTGASYVQTGRGFIGTRIQAAYNYAYGAGRTNVDPSLKVKTKGGQPIVSVRPKFVTMEFVLQWITEAQRWTVQEAMELANGAHKEVLVILDPTSANLGRDCIWGFVDSTPVIVPGGTDEAGGLIHSKSYKIEQQPFDVV